MMNQAAEVAEAAKTAVEYELKVVATGTDIDGILSVIEAMLEHHLAPLSDPDELDDELGQHGLAHFVITDDTAEATATLNAIELDVPLGLDYTAEPEGVTRYSMGRLSHEQR